MDTSESPTGEDMSTPLRSSRREALSVTQAVDGRCPILHRCHRVLVTDVSDGPPHLERFQGHVWMTPTDPWPPSVSLAGTLCIPLSDPLLKGRPRPWHPVSTPSWGRSDSSDGWSRGIRLGVASSNDRGWKPRRRLKHGHTSYSVCAVCGLHSHFALRSDNT